MLFAVLNGKLSEGINLSGDLCRLCVIAGIPLPNANNAEVIAKTELLKQRFTEEFANEFWVSLAMRAVNQAVGRIIRNSKDFGVALLADERFADDRFCSKLSEWIRRSVVKVNDFGEGFVSILKFLKQFESG
ncbi:hypothetical protein GEMRC1_001760 [Eukaryota sp. GEM-RC1]